MQWVRRLAGTEPATMPPMFEGDEVYPIHFLDDLPTLRDIILTWTMRFNDVLDPDILQESLLKVFNTGDWRKLGGRLRKRDGKFQLHVPREFTKERPAFIFTNEKFDVSIEEHPLAKKLPRATANPSIQPGSRDFIPLAMRPDAPTDMKDYLAKDLPQISIHVVSFTDATLVSVMWTHIVMDALGRQEMMKAWSRCLKGEPIQPLLAAREDLVWDAIDPKKNPQVLALEHKRLYGFKFFRFAVRTIWDWLSGPTTQAKTIFIPKWAVDRLRDQAQEGLKNIGKGRGVISRGDVLASWVVQLVARAQPQPRPVTCMGAVDLRTRMPGVFEEGAHTDCTLGEIALKTRETLSTQLAEDQITAYLQIIRREKEEGGDASMVFGETDSIIVPISNAAKAYFHKSVDFSPAVIRAGDTSTKRTNPPGTIIYHHPTFIQVNKVMKNWASITSDREDNYWMTSFFDPRVLRDMEERMAELLL
ncbi:Acetyltransferase pyiB [Cladobotryum mycophilum]|uniref:Acetyltransferase pyiB n=1 Tax=Cladobotryum mycophilum TaxID=491253 RepID=A0ABR0SJV5_9HYPO